MHERWTRLAAAHLHHWALWSKDSFILYFRGFLTQQVTKDEFSGGTSSQPALSGFQVAKQKGRVTGNYNSRRWHSSKYDTSTAGQDWTFTKISLLKLTKQWVQSSENRGWTVTLRCYPHASFPLWSGHKTLCSIQNPHLNEKMKRWGHTAEKSNGDLCFDFIKQMEKKHNLVKTKQ